MGDFLLVPGEEGKPFLIDEETDEKDWLSWVLALLLPAAFLLFLFLAPQKPEAPNQVTPAIEPVTVRVVPDVQKAVPVKPVGASLLAKNITD